MTGDGGLTANQAKHAKTFNHKWTRLDTNEQPSLRSRFGGPREQPYTYLKDRLERLPTMTNQDKLDQLTPLNWKRAREKSLPQAA